MDEQIGIETTTDLASWIDGFEGHLAAGTLKPLEYQLFDGVGWQAVIDAIALLESGKAAKKLVVKVQDG